MGTSSGKFTSSEINTTANNRNNNRPRQPRAIDLTESSTIADDNHLNNVVNLLPIADDNHFNNVVNLLPIADDNHLNNVVVVNVETDESIREENIESPERHRAPKRRLSNTRPINPELAIVGLCTPDAKNEPEKPETKPNNILVTEEPQEKKAKRSRLFCPICFKDFAGQQLATTKCGHVFCQTCIIKALARRNTEHRCPFCQTVLKGHNQQHPIFWQ